MPAASETDDFGFVFDLKGTARDGLKEMAKDLDSIIRLQQIAAAGFAAMNVPAGLARPLDDVNKKLKDIKPNAATGFLALKELAELLANSFGQTVDSIKAMGSEAINVASEVEASKAKLAFSAKKAGIDGIEQSKKLDAAGLKTLQTTQALYNMASSLNLQKVDMFDHALDTLTYMDKTGKQVKATSAEILGDAASMSAKGPEMFMFGLRDAVSSGKIGKGHGLSAMLDMPETFRTRYNKAMAGASTQQEKFNALVKELAKDYGGTAAALGNTFKFMKDQVNDFRDKIYFELMKDILPRLTSMLQGAGAYLTKFIEAGKLDPMRGALNEIFAVIEKGVVRLGALTAKMMEFTSQHPEVIKYIAAFLATTVAIKGALSMLSKFGLATQGLKLGLEFLKPMIKAFKAVSNMDGIKKAFTGLKVLFAPFAPILLNIGIVAGAIALLARLLVKGKDWGDTWDKVRVVFEGISEGVMNMNNGITTLSAETALKLKKTGMFTFVYDFLRIARRVKLFFSGFIDGLAERWPEILASIERVGASLNRIINVILKNAGIVFDDVGNGADTATTSWETFGEKIGLVISLFIEQLFEVLAVVGEIAAGIAEFIDDSKWWMSNLGVTAQMDGAKERFLAANPEVAARIKETEKQRRGASSDDKVVNSYNKRADINELEAVIARQKGTELGEAKGQIDYTKLKEAVTAGMMAAPPPVVEMDGKKMTDRVGHHTMKERQLAK